MRVTFKPAGGRFGFGFDYYCYGCGIFVGNSSEDKQLKHPTTTKQGIFFFRTTKDINCINAGKSCELPKHDIDAIDIL